jgi:hypothetical protein
VGAVMNVVFIVLVAFKLRKSEAKKPTVTPS